MIDCTVVTGNPAALAIGVNGVRPSGRSVRYTDCSFSFKPKRLKTSEISLRRAFVSDVTGIITSIFVESKSYFFSKLSKINSCVKNLYVFLRQ